MYDVYWGESYQCNNLDKNHLNIIYLGNHMRIHTGEKPYQCCHCDETLNVYIDIISHWELVYQTF